MRSWRSCAFFVIICSLWGLHAKKALLEQRFVVKQLKEGLQAWKGDCCVSFVSTSAVSTTWHTNVTGENNRKSSSPEPGWAEEEHGQRFGAPETNPGKLRIAPSTRSGVADVSRGSNECHVPLEGAREAALPGGWWCAEAFFGRKSSTSRWILRLLSSWYLRLKSRVKTTKRPCNQCCSTYRSGCSSFFRQAVLVPRTLQVFDHTFYLCHLTEFLRSFWQPVTGVPVRLSRAQQISSSPACQTIQISEVKRTSAWRR